MTTKISQFLQNYKEWSEQEKYQNFSFIKKISLKQEQDIVESKLNLWPLLFGPLYMGYIGGSCGYMFLFLILCFLMLISIPLGLLLYLLFSIFLCFKANKIYLNILKKEFKIYQKFNPTQKTLYFNISPKRLIICTIITQGFYIFYWFYRNFKAIKTDQNLPLNSLIRSIFYRFTSASVFRGIKYSALSVNYKHNLGIYSNSIYIFVLTGLIVVADQFFNLTTNLGYLYYLITILFTLILISGLLFRFQKAINFYSEKIKFNIITDFKLGEIIIILVGILISHQFLLDIILLPFWLK